MKLREKFCFTIRSVFVDGGIVGMVSALKSLDFSSGLTCVVGSDSLMVHKVLNVFA